MCQSRFAIGIVFTFRKMLLFILKELCLQGETVHGQVVAVNDQTKLLVNKLEKEGQHAVDGDVTTSEASTKIAIHVYQLTKKLLSWLLR